MSNGIASVFDAARKFGQRYNPELVKVERVIESADSHVLRQLVLEHAEKTGSDTAWDILEKWSLNLLSFWKVEPRPKPAMAAAAPAPLSSNKPVKVRAVISSSALGNSPGGSG